MNSRLSRDSNTITIATFWENHLLGKYDFSPPYQRKSVWSEEKESFFIDSILRNYPVPPIFLHQRIDNETGKTSFEVIDGKQRLTSIIKYIENKIPCSTELEEDPSGDLIAGKYFKDLDSAGLSDYKMHFWRYSFPIEYIDTEDQSVVDSIFDRLNRNGEPLRGQELRNANYHGTPLLDLVSGKSKRRFWRTRLKIVDLARMEDLEFISEAVFVLLEEGPLAANQRKLDELYKQYSKSIDIVHIGKLFDEVTRAMDALNVNYKLHKVQGVSHLYGLWCFTYQCVFHEFDTQSLAGRVDDFYTKVRRRENNRWVLDYIDSMSARTKERSQRLRRVNAICSYTGVPIVNE